MSYMDDLKLASKMCRATPAEATQKPTSNDLVLLESEVKVLQESDDPIMWFIEKGINWAYKGDGHTAGKIGKAFIVTLPIIFLVMLSMLALHILQSAKRLKNIEKELAKIDPSELFKWKVYMIDEEGPNAWTFGSNHMFVTSGLMKLINKEELIAVCLHEAGHSHHFDTVKNMSGNALGMAAYPAVMKAGMEFVKKKIGNEESLKPWQFAAISVLMTCLVIGVPKALLIFLGKRMEYAADGYATKKGYGRQLISALRKMEKWIIKEQGGPCKTKICKFFRNMAYLFDEHPPVEKRVKAILEKEETYKKLTSSKNAKQNAKAIAKSEINSRDLQQAIAES